MSSHTQAPWQAGSSYGTTGTRVTGNDGNRHICGVQTDRIDPHGAHHLATIPDPEGMANLALIVASPRLLSALKSAVQLYGKPGGPWNVPSEPGSWINEAKAAIAEAEPASLTRETDVEVEA